MAVTQPFFALYASEVGASTALIGFMVTLKAFLPMFIAMPSGQLIDRIGPENIEIRMLYNFRFAYCDGFQS